MPTLKSLGVATGLIALLALSFTVGARAQGGSEDLQVQIVNALSRGDVAAALGLFTDDAVIDAQSGSCTDAPCVGKDAIRKDLDESPRTRPVASPC